MYLEAGAKVGSFILGNLPVGSTDNDVKSDFQILSNLTSKLLSDVKETELGNFLYCGCWQGSF